MSDLARAIDRLAAAVEAGQRAPVSLPPLPREPGWEYDRLDRKVPKRLDAWSFARGIPGFAAHLAEHMATQGEEDESGP